MALRVGKEPLGRGEETFLEKRFLPPPQTPPLSFPRLSTGGEAARRSVPLTENPRERPVLLAGSGVRSFRLVPSAFFGAGGGGFSACPLRRVPSPGFPSSLPSRPRWREKTFPAPLPSQSGKAENRDSIRTNVLGGGGMGVRGKGGGSPSPEGFLLPSPGLLPAQPSTISSSAPQAPCPGPSRRACAWRGGCTGARAAGRCRRSRTARIRGRIRYVRHGNARAGRIPRNG